MKNSNTTTVNRPSAQGLGLALLVLVTTAWALSPAASVAQQSTNVLEVRTDSTVTIEAASPAPVPAKAQKTPKRRATVTFRGYRNGPIIVIDEKGEQSVLDAGSVPALNQFHPAAMNFWQQRQDEQMERMENQRINDALRLEEARSKAQEELQAQADQQAVIDRERQIRQELQDNLIRANTPTLSASVLARKARTAKSVVPRASSPKNSKVTVPSHLWTVGQPR